MASAKCHDGKNGEISRKFKPPGQVNKTIVYNTMNSLQDGGLGNSHSENKTAKDYNLSLMNGPHVNSDMSGYPGGPPVPPDTFHSGVPVRLTEGSIPSGMQAYMAYGRGGYPGPDQSIDFAQHPGHYGHGSMRAGFPPSGPKPGMSPMRPMAMMAGQTPGMPTGPYPQGYPRMNMMSGQCISQQAGPTPTLNQLLQAPNSQPRSYQNNYDYAGLPIKGPGGDMTSSAIPYGMSSNWGPNMGQRGAYHHQQGMTGGDAYRSQSLGGAGDMPSRRIPSGGYVSGSRSSPSDSQSFTSQSYSPDGERFGPMQPTGPGRPSSQSGSTASGTIPALGSGPQYSSNQQEVVNNGESHPLKIKSEPSSDSEDCIPRRASTGSDDAANSKSNSEVNDHLHHRSTSSSSSSSAATPTSISSSTPTGQQYQHQQSIGHNCSTSPSPSPSLQHHVSSSPPTPLSSHGNSRSNTPSSSTPHSGNQAGSPMPPRPPSNQLETPSKVSSSSSSNSSSKSPLPIQNRSSQSPMLNTNRSSPMPTPNSRSSPMPSQNRTSQSPMQTQGYGNQMMPPPMGPNQPSLGPPGKTIGGMPGQMAPFSHYNSQYPQQQGNFPMRPGGVGVSLPGYPPHPSSFNGPTSVPPDSPMFNTMPNRTALYPNSYPANIPGMTYNNSQNNMAASSSAGASGSNSTIPPAASTAAGAQPGPITNMVGSPNMNCASVPNSSAPLSPGTNSAVQSVKGNAQAAAQAAVLAAASSASSRPPHMHPPSSQLNMFVPGQPPGHLPPSANANMPGYPVAVNHMMLGHGSGNPSGPAPLPGSMHHPMHNSSLLSSSSVPSASVTLPNMPPNHMGVMNSHSIGGVPVMNSMGASPMSMQHSGPSLTPGSMNSGLPISSMPNSVSASSSRLYMTGNESSSLNSTSPSSSPSLGGSSALSSMAAMANSALPLENNSTNNIVSKTISNFSVSSLTNNNSALLLTSSTSNNSTSSPAPASSHSGPVSPAVASSHTHHANQQAQQLPPSHMFMGDAMSPSLNSNNTMCAADNVQPTTTSANSYSGTHTTVVTQSITSPVTSITENSNSSSMDAHSDVFVPNVISSITGPTSNNNNNNKEPDTKKKKITSSKDGPSTQCSTGPPTPGVPIPSPGAASIASSLDSERTQSPSWPTTPVPVTKSIAAVDVSKLYEMGPEPERRSFIDRLMLHLEEKGSPIVAMPAISKQPLDLFRLYVMVRERGGMVEVTKTKKWKEICSLVNISASASAAFTLKKNYIKYVFSFECQFDQGGMDPAPILAHMEAQLQQKRESKQRRAPSPAGSQNSQESFHPGPQQNSHPMDPYGQPPGMMQAGPPFMAHNPNMNAGHMSNNMMQHSGNMMNNMGMPPGSMPPGSMPPGSMPPGSMPPGSMPPGSMPPGSMPPGSMPPGSMPPGSMPPGSMPPGSMPPGSMPPGSMPPGSMPPHGMPPHMMGGMPPQSGPMPGGPLRPGGMMGPPMSHNSMMPGMNSGQPHSQPPPGFMVQNNMSGNNSAPPGSNGPPQQPKGATGNMSPSHPHPPSGAPPPQPSILQGNSDSISVQDPFSDEVKPPVTSSTSSSSQFPRFSTPHSQSIAGYPPTGMPQQPPSAGMGSPSYPGYNQKPPPMVSTTSSTMPQYSSPLNNFSDTQHTPPPPSTTTSSQPQQSQPEQFSSDAANYRRPPGAPVEGAGGYTGPPRHVYGSGVTPTGSPAHFPQYGPQVKNNDRPDQSVPSSGQYRPSSQSQPDTVYPGRYGNQAPVAYMSPTPQQQQSRSQTPQQQHLSTALPFPQTSSPSYPHPSTPSKQQLSGPPASSQPNSSSGYPAYPAAPSGPQLPQVPTSTAVQSGPAMNSSPGHQSPQMNSAPPPGHGSPMSSGPGMYGARGPPPGMLTRENGPTSIYSTPVKKQPGEADRRDGYNMQNQEWCDNASWSPLQQRYPPGGVRHQGSPVPPPHMGAGPYTRVINQRMSPQRDKPFCSPPKSMKSMPGMLPSAHHFVRKELVFPPDCVESVQPVLVKRKLLTKADIGQVDPWRLMLALKSGLLAESTWALDVLAVLLHDDQTFTYFGLHHLPGLLETLLEHLRKTLIQIFDTCDDLEVGFEKYFSGEASSSPKSNKVLIAETMCKQTDNSDSINITRVKNRISFDDEMLSLENYTHTTRNGKAVILEEDTEDTDVVDSKHWDTHCAFESGLDHWHLGGGDTTSHIISHFESSSTLSLTKRLFFNRSLKAVSECNNSTAAVINEEVQEEDKNCHNNEQDVQVCHNAPPPVLQCSNPVEQNDNNMKENPCVTNCNLGEKTSDDLPSNSEQSDCSKEPEITTPNGPKDVYIKEEPVTESEEEDAMHIDTDQCSGSEKGDDDVNSENSAQKDRTSVEFDKDVNVKAEVNDSDNSADNEEPACNDSKASVCSDTAIDAKVENDNNTNSNSSNVNDTDKAQIFSENSLIETREDLDKQREVFRGLKRALAEDFEDEVYQYDEPLLCLHSDSQIDVQNRCMLISNILRNLSFLPGNDIEMAKHPGLLFVLGRLLQLHHTHPKRSKVRHRFDKEEPVEVEDTPDSIVDPVMEPWWECLNVLRENTFVILSNICGRLNLVRFPEEICRPLLLGLLHWSVCPSASALDPFPTLPGSSLSPQRLVMEALCKLTVHRPNVDLMLATPPFSQIVQLLSNLVDFLSDPKQRIMQEFSVVLLSTFIQADPIAARVVALQHPSVSLFIDFVETAEQNAMQIANNHGLQALRDNPESMGTSLDMLRRAATALHRISRVPANRNVVLPHQNRLLALVMSQILDQNVTRILSDVLYECSQS